VVESELDGLLLSKCTSKFTNTIALGSAQTRPDKELHEVLLKARLILVSLDSDPIGAKQTKFWWLKQYKNAVWWPIPLQFGKDPGEAYQNGYNLKRWIEAALAKYVKNLSPNLFSRNTICKFTQ
jgi:hypothetical protein